MKARRIKRYVLSGVLRLEFSDDDSNLRLAPNAVYLGAKDGAPRLAVWAIVPVSPPIRRAADENLSSFVAWDHCPEQRTGQWSHPTGKFSSAARLTNRGYRQNG
jgi:hypothetical protein